MSGRRTSKQLTNNGGSSALDKIQAGMAAIERRLESLEAAVPRRSTDRLPPPPPITDHQEN